MITEEKFDKLYDLVTEMHGDMKAYKVEQDNHKEQILENYKNIKDHKVITDNLVANKNKAIGAAAAFGTFFGMVGTSIAYLTKHL